MSTEANSIRAFHVYGVDNHRLNKESPSVSAIEGIAKKSLTGLISSELLLRQSQLQPGFVPQVIDLITDSASEVRAGISLFLISDAIATNSGSVSNADLSLSAASIATIIMNAPFLALKTYKVAQDFNARWREEGLQKAIDKEMGAASCNTLAVSTATAANACAKASQIGVIVNNANPALAIGASAVYSIAGPLSSALGVIPGAIFTYMGIKSLRRASEIKSKIAGCIKNAPYKELELSKEFSCTVKDYSKAFQMFNESRKVSADEVLSGISKDSDKRESLMKKFFIQRTINQVKELLDQIDPKHSDEWIDDIGKAKKYSRVEWESKIVEVVTHLDALPEELHESILLSFGLSKQLQEKLSSWKSLSAKMGFALSMKESFLKKEETLRNLLGESLYKELNVAQKINRSGIPLLLDTEKEVENPQALLEKIEQSLSLNIFSKKSNMLKPLLQCIAGISMVLSGICAVIALFFAPMIFTMIATSFWLLQSMSFICLDIMALWKALSSNDKDYNYKQTIIRLVITLSYITFAIGILTFAVFCFLNPYSLPFVITFALVYLIWLSINFYIEFGLKKSPPEELAQDSVDQKAVEMGSIQAFA